MRKVLLIPGRDEWERETEIEKEGEREREWKHRNGMNVEEDWSTAERVEEISRRLVPARFSSRQWYWM